MSCLAVMSSGKASELQDGSPSTGRSICFSHDETVSEMVFLFISLSTLH